MNFKKRHLIGIILSIYLSLGLSEPVIAAPIELTLTNSIALALQNNSTIKIAKNNKDESLWAEKQAQAQKGFSLDYTHTSEPFNTSYNEIFYTADSINENFQNELSLKFPIYSGGKLEYQIEQAKWKSKSSELNANIAKQQLQMEVAKSYFNVVKLADELKVCNQTIDCLEKELQIVQAKYEEGVVAQSEVLSIQVNLSDAQDNLFTVQNNYHNASEAFNQIVGLPANTEFNLVDKLEYREYTMSLEECIEFTLKNQPTIADDKAKIAISADDLKIAESNDLPVVDLSASQIFYDKNFPGLKNNSWQVGLTVSMNILDSGANKAKIKKEQYRLETVKEEAKKNRDEILLNIRQYYSDMYNSEKRVNLDNDALDQAERYLQMELDRYEAGVNDTFDVINAAILLDKAKKNRLYALYDYNVGKIELERAMGMVVKE
jgi:outer membrane protein